MDMTPRETILKACREIPRGRAINYGGLGELCGQSGRAVGRIMASCPSDVPWWRVVAWDGSLPIAKRDPKLAELQRSHLIAEGVRFDGPRVCRECMIGSESL